MRIQQTNSFRSIPVGVADYFWTEAYERKRLESTILNVFRSSGYTDVIPPCFEFADVFQFAKRGDLVSQDTYRFTDRDGSILALRYDFTVAIARLVGTRLYDQPFPQRYCYGGSVFRYEEPQAGRQREFFQVGLELVGEGNAEADAETLCMVVEALNTVALPKFQLSIGHSLFFEGLSEDLSLSSAAHTALRHAVSRRSEPELKEFLANVSLADAQINAVKAVMRLNGEVDILKDAESFCLNDKMYSALENLVGVYDMLCTNGFQEYSRFDLAEIMDLGYYTGITFEVFTPNLGFGIANGGRYDNLLERFGSPLPAVGATIGIDRLLLSLVAQRSEPRMLVPHALAVGFTDYQSVSLLRGLRQAGAVVVRAFGNANSDPWQYARKLSISRVLYWHEGVLTLHELPMGSDSKLDSQDFIVRQLDLERLDKEVAIWLN